MDQDFGRDVISITNEEGEEFELEVLSSVTYKGAEYLALTPADADEDTDELEVNILKTATDEHGEPILVVVDDNEELETVYDLLMENLYDEDEDEDVTPAAHKAAGIPVELLDADNTLPMIGRHRAGMQMGVKPVSKAPKVER